MRSLSFHTELSNKLVMVPQNVVRTNIVSAAISTARDTRHAFFTVKSDATPAEKGMNTADTMAIM